MSSSINLILEVGHQLNHFTEYLTGETTVHMHSLGHSSANSHEHKVISRLAELINVSKENNKILMSQEFKFEQIKLVNPDNVEISLVLKNIGASFYYSFSINSPCRLLPSPPPKYV